MKACVVGAGAIGGMIGAHLARAGQEVSLVARGAHLDALRREGLALLTEGRRESFPLVASDRPGEFGVQDLVLITLKAYSIPAMLPALGPLIGPDTVVIPAINGIPWWYFYREGGSFDGRPIACLDPEGTMFAALDPKHIIGCVVHASAEVTAPGEVTHTSGRRLIIGEPAGSLSERLERVAGVLARAGFDVAQSDSIRVDVWAKLIGNLAYNPVAALTLSPMHEINANPGLVALIRAMMEEAMAVAEAYGVRIPMTVEERIEIAKKIGTAKISMHQDVERGRPLEVAAIIGSVVEFARGASVPTPMIEVVHALASERARHLALAA